MNEVTNEPSRAAFSALAEDLTWFIMCPEIRILHVATSGTERPAVVHQMALTEGHGHNKSPFFVLEDAHTKDEPGWMVRAERLAVIHEARRAMLAPEGYSLPATPALVHGNDPIAAFAWQLQQCLEAQRDVPELEGLVVVLAPTVLEQPHVFAESVLALVRSAAMAQVRFIVVEIGESLAKAFEAGLGDTAMFATCAVDPMQYRREQTESLAAAAAAPVGASPEVGMGGAGPKDIVAPPRFGKPSREAPITPEQEALLTKQLGPAAALLGSGGGLLRQRIAAAALAVQESRFEVAITLQKEAFAQCFEAGLLRFACIIEVTLAAYLLQAGEPARSRAAFETAAARAEGAKLFDVAAQALLGLAAVLLLQKDFAGSVARYVQAGELAVKDGGSTLLAIEAYRTAGQVALRARAERAAIAAWTRGLEIASAALPEETAHSSAPTLARSLAKVLQGHGAFSAAESLLAHADEYERAADVNAKSAAAHDAEPDVGAAQVGA